MVEWKCAIPQQFLIHQVPHIMSTLLLGLNLLGLTFYLYFVKLIGYEVFPLMRYIFFGQNCRP